MKAIALLSGGLDSRLAIKLMLDQKVDIHALHFTSIFAPCSDREVEIAEAEQAAGEFGVPLTVQDITEDLIALVKSAPHGRGSGVNPCIDCRIMQLRRAKRLMPEVGAGFVVTGEVRGQRPMSQRHDAMNVIEREAGLEGLLVRPLCARLLEPTIPEKRDWIDRDRLKRIAGRGRKPQMELAEELGISDYPAPAGGCRLTEPNYARRMEDLLNHGELNIDNVRLLEVGRHFRLGENTKLVVGREHEENLRIEEPARPDNHILVARNFPGPTSLGRGQFTDKLLRLAARITARYGQGKGEDKVLIDIAGPRHAAPLVRPATDEELERYRL